MSVQCLCEKCGGTVPASLALYETDGFVSGVLRKQSVKKSIPMLVFVDNDEIADDCSTTAHAIFRAELGEVVYWNERFYDDKEDFVDAYISRLWRQGIPEEVLERRAARLWAIYAQECIVCYSRAALPPKGCEVVE